MTKKLAIKLAVYSALSLVAIGLLAGGYVWYSMDKTMKAMYEPLPSSKWVEPAFEPEPESEPSGNGRGGATKEASGEGAGEGESPQAPGTVAAVPVSASTPDESPKTLLSEREAQRIRNPNLGNEEPFTILLLGVDERAGDRGRSDTMILLTVQPKTGSALALSIPRDTRAFMPNSGKYDKINHAYAFGGTSLSVQAVEQLFGVPISYYMKTNMEGFVNIVDIVGGVDVNNERSFDYEGATFPVGMQHLDGEHALLYSRMRKEDPHGDFGRTSRQRQVLSDAIDKVVRVNSITKLPKLLSQLSQYVRTSLTSGDMIDLAMNYRPAIKNVKTLILQGQGKMIGGIYYYSVTPEARRSIQKEMLEHLGY
ncbi:LCP family protein [Cohnella suwonensis]|uniref:LCP family protein n=1 Tax=Cohnella suwonensis TaxID=696072 RepID=A0ABW0M3M4_9BACL